MKECVREKTENILLEKAKAIGFTVGFSSSPLDGSRHGPASTLQARRPATAPPRHADASRTSSAPGAPQARHSHTVTHNTAITTPHRRTPDRGWPRIMRRHSTTLDSSQRSAALCIAAVFASGSRVRVFPSGGIVCESSVMTDSDRAENRVGWCWSGDD